MKKISKLIFAALMIAAAVTLSSCASEGGTGKDTSV